MENKNCKLFFSSFGFNSPIVCSKFAKVMPRVEDLEDKTCFVLPYAGFHTERTFKREKRGLMRFGFSSDLIKFVKNRGDLLSERCDFIYVPGGNPFKLLQTIKEIGLEEEIVDCVKNRGATYIGVSAGADIATKNIAYVMELEDNNEVEDGDFSALGLISETILCHYDHRSFSLLKACERISGSQMITINDDQLLKYENGTWEYIGEENDSDYR